MLNLKNIFAAASLSVVAMTSNASEFVLDSFDYANESAIQIAVDLLVDGDPRPDAIVSDSVSVNTASGFNQAVYTLSLVDDAPNAFDSASVSTVTAGVGVDGILSYNEASGIDSSLNITYTSNVFDTLDISAFTSFYFDVLSADVGFLVELELFSTDVLGDVVSSIISISPGLVEVPERIFVDFSDLAEEVDLTALTSISATISSDGIAADLVIAEVGLVNVPEPTTLAIFGLGLLGLGLRRRNA